MTRGASIRRALAVLAGALALAAPAAARDKLDTVRLKNGDHTTCEIVELRSGYLHVRTSSFGTVDIERSDLAALISAQYFEIELADGRRLVGALDEGTSPGRLGIHTQAYELVEVPFEEVFQIRQVGSTFWRTRRGRLNAGLDFGSSDESTHFTLDGELTFQGRRFRFDNGLQGSVDSDEDSDAKERATAWSELEIPLGRLFAVAGRGTYDRNTELELDARYTASGAFLWFPWRSDRGRFAAGAGIAESRETYLDESSHSVTMGVLFLSVEYYRFGDFGTRVSTEVAYLPSLSGEERHRLEVRGTFTQKIAGDFNFSLSPYYSYDSRTPIEGLENEDWGYIASVGWTF